MEVAARMNPALSIWLDLCRVVAALAVYVGHSVALGVAPPSWSITWHRSADDAVTAFFVISGLVIAYTTQKLRRDEGGRYALARLSRVYSVALPAVLLALVIDHVGMRLDVTHYEADWQYPRFWLYLPVHWLFLGETWLGAIQPFTMAPYWSLGYEVWYYVLFGCLTFLTGWRRTLAVGCVVLIMGPRIVLLLPVWWLGVFLYHHLDRLTPSPAVGRVFMLLAVVSYVAYFLSGLRLTTDEASRALYAAFANASPLGFDAGSTVHVLSDYPVAVLFAMFVVGCAGSGIRFGAMVERGIRWLAGYTFSFYLIHFTLLVFARAAGLEHAGGIGYALLLFAVFLCTWALGQVGEQRRDVYRDVMRAAWGWLVTLGRRRPPLPRV
jgi:peptidoglycan/LPS O-acetylase OafA/YrhL